MFKRIISVFLTSIMILGIYSQAYAYTDLKVSEQAYINDVLASGIMKGDLNGYFHPYDFLTKAEAAAIMTRMKGYANSYLANPSGFVDVPKSHWASQVIGLAASINLVKGDEYGCFYPDSYVTSAEFITMCLRLLGVGELLDSTERWPYAHMEFCQNEGILKRLPKSVFDPITRLEAANIVSQFLSANIWKRNYSSGLFEKTNSTIMSENLGLKFYSNAVIYSIDDSYREIDILVLEDEDEEYGYTYGYDYDYDYTKGRRTDKIEAIKIPGSVDIDDLQIGQTANIYMKGNSAVKIDILDDADSRVVVFDDITEFNYSSGYIKFVVDGRNRRYDLNETLLTVTANGVTKTGTESSMSGAKRLIQNIMDSDDRNYDDEDDEDEDAGVNVSGRIILDANDRIISLTLARYAKMILVSKISGERITGSSTSLHTVSGVKKTSLSLNGRDYDIRDAQGRAIDLDDVNKGDVLLYSDKGEPYSLLLLDKRVTGKVTYVEDSGDDDPEYIEIDDVEYHVNKQFCSSLPSKGSTKRTFYLDNNDKIIGWK